MKSKLLFCFYGDSYSVKTCFFGWPNQSLFVYCKLEKFSRKYAMKISFIVIFNWSKR